MCGVTPKPYDPAAVQTAAAQATSTYSQQQTTQVKADLKACEARADAVLAATGAGYQAPAPTVNHTALGPAIPLAPSPACLPPPSLDLSCAPAGRGLQTNPTGWPAGSVQTAGGYTVVPEGKDAAWRIYGPNQAPTDQPLSRIWGDPHVTEADGTKWDFTKSSNFRLPDGTLIDVKTTSEYGQSVSQSLNIVNGNDRVTIGGIDKNKPWTGPVTNDGFAFRSEQYAANPNRETFVLGGTNRHSDGQDRVQWSKEVGGQNLGVVVGARSNVDGRGSYDQILDPTKKFVIDSSLRPDPFTNPTAWTNNLRGSVADAAGMYLGPWARDAVVGGLEAADTRDRWREDMLHHQRRFAFGGAGYGVFGQQGLQRSFGFAERMFSMLFDQMSLSSSVNQTLNLNRGLYV